VEVQIVIPLDTVEVQIAIPLDTGGGTDCNTFGHCGGTDCDTFVHRWRYRLQYLWTQIGVPLIRAKLLPNNYHGRLKKIYAKYPG